MGARLQELSRGLAVLTAFAVGSELAWASGEGHAPGPAASNSITTVLLLLFMVGIAYLVAHFAVDYVQRRLLVGTGLEYVLLGLLLGPHVVTQIHVLDDLSGMAPIIAFAAGWVGLLYGMELDLSTLLTIPDRSVRLAFTDVLTTVGVVGGGSAWALQAGLPGWPSLSPSEIWLAAGALAAAAAASSSSAVDLVSSRYPDLESRLVPLLRRTARLEDLLAIAVFGTLFCIFHQGMTRTATQPSFSDWILLTVGLGLVLGFLFSAFLGEEEENTHQRFLAMVGILVFASGAAFFLNLSALLVNLLLGVVIVNTRHGKGVFQVLVGTQTPVRLILLVFAGALWAPVSVGPAVSLSVGFVALRFSAKVLSCWLAALGTTLRNDLFRGLLAQGDVAIAMAISLSLVYDGPAVDLAFTAIVASTVLYELIAPRLLKGLLVDAGELRQDVPLGPSEAVGG